MSPDPENAPRKRGRGADPAQTRADLVDAAIASLVEDGYRGTTARSIATRANCNQAAIYYHFNGIEPLLIEALEQSSVRVLRRYEDALRDDAAIPELVQRLEGLYREDRDSGHLALLTEMVGGITASPELRAGIETAIQPWLTFVEEQIRHHAETLPFGSLLPTTELADLIFSLIVGVELRNRLDDNHERSDRLFQLGQLVAALVATQGGPAEPS